MTAKRTSPRRRAALLAFLLLHPLAGVPAGAQREAAAGGEPHASAWEEYVGRNPEAVNDGTIGPLERRVLHAMTPEQAAAFDAGTPPEQIELASGETLAELFAAALSAGPVLAYVPVEQCRLFSTLLQTAPVTGSMAAGEIREYVARGSGTAHTDQGGVVDCLIPDEAVAIAIHFQVVSDATADQGLLKAWAADAPEPLTVIRDYEPNVERFNTAAVVELCPLGACAAGELKVKTVLLGAHVRGDVTGFFRPLEAADIPGGSGGGLGAGTLDGLDSDQFLRSDTGDSFTSGALTTDAGTTLEVAGALDASGATATGLPAAGVTGAGAGSGLDSDLLDGKQATAFRPRPQNVILVGKNGCDFLSIQAALDAIGVDPRFPAATPSNRYLVSVGPGEYAEQVTMEPYVDIEGAGQKQTRITAAVDGATLGGADDAALRHLEVVNTGGGASSVAVLNNGASPMLLWVAADASGGTTENIGVLNDGAAAAPMLDHVVAYAGAAPPTPTDIGVVNQNGASPTIRNSSLAGTTAAIENRDTATARIANTELMGDAAVMAPATQASYMCVRAFEAGTLTQLNEECSGNTPPTATDDAYATLGNTLLEVAVAASGAPAVVGPDPGPLYADVLANDTDAETPGALTATLDGGSVSVGAVVSMSPDGSFSYMPPAGFIGMDSFTYTLADPGGLTDTGVVEITISERVWFVDDVNGSDATGDGRSDNPFASLAPLTAGGGSDALDGAGDTLFLFADDGATADGIVLENSQILHGHGVALDFAGFTFAAGSVLVAASTEPTVTSATTNGITLASGNTVRGLNIGSTTGAAISGTSVTAGTFEGIDISGSLTSGVNLSSASGTFTFTGTNTISGVAGSAFNVAGGSATVTYSGGITQASNAATIGVSGGHTGTLTFQNGTISATNGSGLQFSDADGTYSFNGTTTLAGGDAGIDILSGSAGTFTFGNATSITNPGGTAFNAESSSANVDYAGSITQNNAASGVRLSANTGSVTFRGGLSLSTSTAGAFTASGGGTVNVCATADCAGGAAVTNTLATTSGIALNVSSTTIGSEGLTFRSISANGAANGIVLNGTGAGGLTVTGDGSTATQGGNDTGGVIQSTSGDGIVLTTAQGITLRNMTIGDTAAAPADSPDATANIAGDGIQASGVTNLSLFNVTIARTGDHGVNAVSPGAGLASITNLTLEDSLILNAGDAQEEHGLNLDELRGDNFVRRSLFDAFNESGIELINASGAVDLTVDNTTFQDNKATVGNAGEEAILIEAQGTASIVALVTGDSNLATTDSIFDDIARQGVQGISLGATSDLQLTVENSDFLETQAGDGVIILNPDNSGSANITVKNNSFTDDTLGPFAVLLKNDSTGTLDATLQGNNVTNMQLGSLNHDNLGSGGAANGTSRVKVGGTGMGEGNTVTVGSNNIAFDVIAVETPPTGSSPDVSLTIQNNTTSQPDGNFTFTPGTRIDIQQASRVNVNISGNSFQGDPTAAAAGGAGLGQSGIELKEQNSSVVGLQGFAGGTTASAETFIDGANPLSDDISFVTSSVDGVIGSGTATAPTATTRPNP